MSPTYMEIGDMCLVSSSIYNYLDKNGRKICRYKSAKDQLFADKTVLNGFKWKHKNLSLAWVDYKKAYDKVLYFFIIECLKPVNVSEGQRSTSSWKTKITACGQTLVPVEIKRVMFQGDTLIVVSCMILLCSVLRKIETGYIVGNVKINNFLFMDNLEMF